MLFRGFSDLAGWWCGFRIHHWSAATMLPLYSRLVGVFSKAIILPLEKNSHYLLGFYSIQFKDTIKTDLYERMPEAKTNHKAICVWTLSTFNMFYSDIFMQPACKVLWAKDLNVLKI